MSLAGAALGSIAGCAPQLGRFRHPERLSRLTRGVNLSHWFAQSPVSDERLRSFYGARDFELLRGAGVAHVRLPLRPEVLLDERRPAALGARNLRHLDAALAKILAAGLAVIVELHPEDPFVARLERDAAFVAVVAQFWEALARHLGGYDPGSMFLEALNEAHFDSPPRWEPVLRQLLAAMRSGAPQHTLIASGNDWAGIRGLVLLTPVEDANVVYNFHFYEPFVFTHQGAEWGDPQWRHLRGVPYPSSPADVAEAAGRAGSPGARAMVRQYGVERWGPERIERRIGEAVAWAERHRVPLTCNEFGAYRAVAPPDARLAYLRDVRSALERRAIGWAMWDYAGGFGVAVEGAGGRRLDPATLAALGLG